MSQLYPIIYPIKPNMTMKMFHYNYSSVHWKLVNTIIKIIIMKKIEDETLIQRITYKLPRKPLWKSYIQIVKIFSKHAISCFSCTYYSNTAQKMLSQSMNICIQKVIVITPWHHQKRFWMFFAERSSSYQQLYQASLWWLGGGTKTCTQLRPVRVNLNIPQYCPRRGME